MEKPFRVHSSNELRRQGTVFFIGGSLPVLETLETMYESCCQESSGLFHVTFAGGEEIKGNLELVRQIKKNFSVRLMGRLSHTLPDMLFEQLYLAGLDVLDIPYKVFAGVKGTSVEDRMRDIVRACAIFPRWALTSSLQVNEMETPALRNAIDNLLSNGIIPLLNMPDQISAEAREDVIALFGYIADAWQRYEVPLKPLLPLIELTTPLESNKGGGFLRSAIDMFHDKRMLATSDLRRHLRTKEAEASFESSGL
jgi:hypothetical protein